MATHTAYDLYNDTRGRRTGTVPTADGCVCGRKSVAPRATPNPTEPKPVCRTRARRPADVSEIGVPAARSVLHRWWARERFPARTRLLRSPLTDSTAIAPVFFAYFFGSVLPVREASRVPYHPPDRDRSSRAPSWSHGLMDRIALARWLAQQTR